MKHNIKENQKDNIESKKNFKSSMKEVDKKRLNVRTIRFKVAFGFKNEEHEGLDKTNSTKTSPEWGFQDAGSSGRADFEDKSIYEGHVIYFYK